MSSELSTEQSSTDQLSADSSMQTDLPRDASSGYQGEEKDGRPTRGRTTRRLLLTLLALLILGLAAAGTWTALRAWPAYQQAQRLLDLAQTGDPLSNLPEIQRNLGELSTSATAIQGDIGRVAPLLHLLDGMTPYGSAIAALPELTAGGATLTTLISDATDLLAPELAAATGTSILDQAASALATSGPALAELAPRAAEAADALASVDAAALPPLLGNLLGEGQPLVAALPAALEMAPVMDDLLGFEEEKTYLILVQNNHELRATGGFITAIGRATVKDGQITELDFADSYRFFSKTSAYPPAPAPMQKYMQLQLMLLRDTNWSPDLPTTAQLAQTLYAQETGIDVDGVVTIDMHAVEYLVDALGPLKVEGSAQLVTGKNVIGAVKEFWARPLDESDDDAGAVRDDSWWIQRKDFMPALAGAALARLQQGDVDPVDLARAGLTALNDRAIQVVLDNPDGAEIMHAMGWDGALTPVAGEDFLALVDSNLGYNKVDSVIERTLDYSIDWNGGNDGAPLATATVTYRHPIDAPDHVCDITPRYGETYDEMTQRCYFDYVRLFVPVESKLVGTTGLEADSVEDRRGEKGTRLFSGYFVLSPGQEHTISFTYQLPAELSADNYALNIRRQAGTRPLPVTIELGDGPTDLLVEEGSLRWEKED